MYFIWTRAWGKLISLKFFLSQHLPTHTQSYRILYTNKKNRVFCLKNCREAGRQNPTKGHVFRIFRKNFEIFFNEIDCKQLRDFLWKFRKKQIFVKKKGSQRESQQFFPGKSDMTFCWVLTWYIYLEWNCTKFNIKNIET